VCVRVGYWAASRRVGTELIVIAIVQYSVTETICEPLALMHRHLAHARLGLLGLSWGQLPWFQAQLVPATLGLGSFGATTHGFGFQCDWSIGSQPGS
jgi:hypothetical protein